MRETSEPTRRRVSICAADSCAGMRLVGDVCFCFPSQMKCRRACQFHFRSAQTCLHLCMIVKFKKKTCSEHSPPLEIKRSLTGLASLVTLRDTEHVEPCILKEDSTLMLAERG